jgi:ribosome recycling factor
MGNHGVYSGNSEALGDFMASLPLGLLKAGKGTTELAPQVIGGPKGRTVQGLKDVIGGGLQAAQIPSAFVAPEAATEKGVADVAGNTGRVQQTIANLAKDAGGIEKDIAPTAADPYGFRQVASEQIGKYKAAAKKLDELSHDAFSDAQQDVEDATDDFTAAGKKAYREAQQKLNDIITKYKPALKDAGVDADSMKADYRKGMANNKIATFLNKTTEETGKDVMQATAKAGSGLKEALLDLAQNQKDLLSRAGWQDAHINQAVQSARELIPSVTQRVVNAVTKHAGLGVATALGGAAGGLVAKEVVK